MNEKLKREEAILKWKLKKKQHLRMNRLAVGIPCLIVLVCAMYWAHSLFFTSKEEEVIRTVVGDFKTGDVIIGAYIDGTYSSNFPTKVSGYIVDKVECDNGATGSWDSNTWDLNVSGITKRTKCSVYFKQLPVTDRIIASVDTNNNCPTLNSDGTVNVTGAEATNGYVCSAKDAYGTSYYFRGNVSNNYVKFANFYWRILRINGDGTIRLIYDGTTAHANGEASEDRMIGNSDYNTTYNDNAYVGYMYGTPGSSSYSATHTNTNDSTIKTYIDNWYTTNLSAYASYLADNVFCNDRQPSAFSDLTHKNYGYGRNSTYYRWARGPWDGSSYANVYVNLTCAQKNDAFTVSDTTHGNGALKYPTGLISADEAVLAGTWSSANSGYYLYTGSQYWTASAGSFTAVASGNRMIDTDGSSPNFSLVNLSIGVKPVINLKANSLIEGIGTMDNPYTIN